MKILNLENEELRAEQVHSRTTNEQVTASHNRPQIKHYFNFFYAVLS